MEVSNGEAFYRKLYQDAEARGADPDYEGMDQGPEGTKARHDAALARLSKQMHMGTVLDLGCGTGLFVDALSEACVTPTFYTGVDLLPERRSAVRRRLQDAVIAGRFEDRDLTSGDLGPKGATFTVAVALGLMGPMPFHTMLSLLSLVRRMRECANHGLVTIPMQRPEFLGCEYQTHFDMCDVDYILRREGYRDIKVEQNTYKEMVIWW